MTGATRAFPRPRDAETARAGDNSHMLLRREEGQTMAEYGVVLGMVVILTFTAWVLLRDATTALLDKVVTGLH